MKSVAPPHDCRPRADRASGISRAALMNASLQRDLFANAGRTDYSTQDLVGASLNMERPKLPAPHQVASELYKLVFATPPTSKRSLVYHGRDHA